MMSESNIQLTVFQDEDIALFEQWLNKDYIYKWFCCDGKEVGQAHSGGLEEKHVWLDEVISREKNPHRYLFIVTCDGLNIGFGICVDLTGEPEYMAEQYPDLNRKIKTGTIVSSWSKQLEILCPPVDNSPETFHRRFPINRKPV